MVFWILLNELLCSSHGQWQAECPGRMLRVAPLVDSVFARSLAQELCVLFVY
jgi:hypothetical protein